MHMITARNVNDALRKGLDLLWDMGEKVEVRGQSTLETIGPVITKYCLPRQRVLFSPLRDANHFFHFFEALWILAGRQDVAFLNQFNSRIHEFSDDTVVFHGAYGFRLRQVHNFDQIRLVIQLLRRDPNTRRAVMTIWIPVKDLNVESKDIPCNVTIAFLARGGVLDMTVFCRSNDIIWGAYGANVVQFSTLLEVIAALVGLIPGRYYQISNSFHAYDQREDWKKLITGYKVVDLYAEKSLRPYSMVADPNSFLNEVITFLEHPEAGIVYRNPFFDEVARPLWDAWQRHKKTKDGLAVVDECKADDWRIACREWLERREKTSLSK